MCTQFLHTHKTYTLFGRLVSNLPYGNAVAFTSYCLSTIYVFITGWWSLKPFEGHDKLMSIFLSQKKFQWTPLTKSQNSNLLLQTFLATLMPGNSLTQLSTLRYTQDVAPAACGSVCMPAQTKPAGIKILTNTANISTNNVVWNRQWDRWLKTDRQRVKLIQSVWLSITA